MSKKAKNAQKLNRLAKKRAMKAANKAHYAELRRLGQNSKSKRFMQNKKKKRLAKMYDHPDGRCGNIGCRKCDPCNLYN
jgi:hypothetical protein